MHDFLKLVLVIGATNPIMVAFFTIVWFYESFLEGAINVFQNRIFIFYPLITNYNPRQWLII